MSENSDKLKKGPVVALPPESSLSLVFLVRGSIVNVLSHNLKIDVEKLEKTREAVSIILQKIGMENIDMGDKDVREFFEGALAIQLRKLLDLRDHKVLITRSGVQDAMDSAVFIHFSPKPKEEVSDGYQDSF